MENSTSQTEDQEVVETPTEVTHPDGSPDGTERTELEQDDDIDIGDFLAAKAGLGDNLGKEPTTKGEDPKEEPTEVVEPEAKPIVEQKQQTTKFPSREDQLKELGITDDKDIQALKKMGNESFAYVKKLIEKSKGFDVEIGKYKGEVETLKSKAQQTSHPTLYNHPEGYRLTPEYNNTQKAVDMSRGVMDHWVTQLAKIRRGEKFQTLSADKNGNIFVEAEELEPTVEYEVYVSKELANAQRYVNQYENKLNEIQNTHIARRKADESFIKEQEDKFFPNYDDPKHETAEAQKKFRGMLPDTMQEYVPTSIFVKTVANNALFAKKLQAAETEIQQLKAKLGNGASKPKGQNPNTKLTSKPVSQQSTNTMQDDEITMEDFHRARSRI